MLMLVEEVLDAQLCDFAGEKVGRVDDLVLQLSSEGPPRISAILIGGEVRATRIGKWMLAVHHAIGALLRSGDAGTSRVSFDKVQRIGDTVQLDVDERELSSERLERWLRDHIVLHIPGASGERK